MAQITQKMGDQRTVRRLRRLIMRDEKTQKIIRKLYHDQGAKREFAARIPLGKPHRESLSRSESCIAWHH